MTAQGGDLLAWLDRAITVRQQAATAASGRTWRADDWGNVQTDQHETVAEVWPLSGAQPESNVEFIAANDPESVLRRCAADRKLIAAHGPWTADERALIGEPASDQSCKGCGFNNQEEPMVADYRGCPVLNALAEGYGWTEGER